MPNLIKSATTVSNGTIKRNNFLIAVDTSLQYGTTESTGFWSGIIPPTSGYTVYAQKESQGPSIRVASTNSELITIAIQYGGTNINDINDALNFFNSQPQYLVTNIDYGNIITSGLTVLLDAGYIPSYPRSGTTWSDLSGNDRNTSLLNGPSYNSDYGGSLFFDGSDDYLSIPYFNQTTQSFAVETWFKPQQNTEYLRGILSCGDIWSGGLVGTGWCLGYFPENTQISYGVKGSDGTIYRETGPLLSANTIYNLFMVRNTEENILRLYVNGALYNSVAVPSSVSLSGNRLTITHRIWEYSPIGPFGDFYSIKVYNNKSFTSSEVLQNYNAQKSRYGL
jgi:hypothetical protein